MSRFASLLPGVLPGVCILALQLLLPTTASAETVTADSTKALTSCYADSEIRTEVSYCLQAALQSADQQLNARYLQAMDQAKLLDSRAQHGRVAVSLASSQKAFELFREQQCQLKLELAFPGSGATDVYRSCMIGYAQWRVEILDKLLLMSAQR